MSIVDTFVEQRMRTWEKAKGLLDHAESQKRDLTAEEARQYDEMIADMETLRGRIDSARTAESEQLDAERRSFELLGPNGSTTHRSDQAFVDEIRASVANNDRRPIEVGPVHRRSGYQPGVERRALSTASGSGLQSTSFYDQVILHAVDSSAVLAAGATVVTTEGGNTLKVPRTTAYSSAGIVSEAGTIPSSDPTLGSATFSSYKFAFLVKVSTELLEDASFDVAGMLAEQAGLAIGNGFGSYAITGTGTSQPTGAVTAATLGVTGGTGVTGAFTGDNLIDLYHSLAEPYARSKSAGWLMRNNTLGAVRTLKDGQQRYLFDAAIPDGVAGASGQLLGRPVFADPNVAAVALSAKSVIFGDWSKYWVRLAGPLRFERSDDFAFDTDQVTFRVLARMDGNLVDTSGALKFFAGAAT